MCRSGVFIFSAIFHILLHPVVVPSISWTRAGDPSSNPSVYLYKRTIILVFFLCLISNIY
jgi:hypothetical protein